MANQGAKKRKDENTQQMSKLRLIMIACNILYIIVRLLVAHASLTWKHWIGLVVTSLGYGVPYKLLDQMAKPSVTVTDDGELIDGGSDAGMCGYMNDVLYVTCFVHLGSIISGKFWYAYLVIPAFGTYKASALIKEFLSHASEEGVKDEKTREKREKMERKTRKKTRSR